MTISTQVSTQPSAISQVNPRTFDWGQRGTIEMKPIEDVAYSTLAPGKPQSIQRVQREPLDPYGMLEEQQRLDIQRIESEHAIAMSQLTEKPDYKTATLEREFEIQDARLRDKFRDKPLNEYHEARKQLIAQKEVAALRIQDKIRPEVDKLNMARQQAVAGIQTNYAKKKIELDMIQKLVDAGKIQDPIMGLQQQYEEIGINVPLSYLRPDPAQELRDLRQLIEYFKNKMDISKSIKEEYGAALLPPGELELFNEATKRHRELMLQLYGGLANDPNFVDRPKLSDANQDMTENKGGTIGGLVGGSKVTKTLDKTGAMTILQEAGGDKELARQIAASRGYKF